MTGIENLKTKGFNYDYVRLVSFALACLTFSCTNNLFSNFGGRQNLATNSGFGGGQNIFTLSTVVQSNSVGGAIEFIGNGEGEFGEFCLSENQQTPTNEGASLCECQFDYVNSFGQPEQIRIETSYHEENMIRCDNAIPSGITNVDASVYLKTANVNSNKISTTLPDFGNLLDLSDASSYDRIYPLQCRDLVFIPQLFASLFYDPIQSESPLISYPRYYFTNSVARSVISLYNNSTTGQGAQTFSKFECATDSGNRPFWFNPFVYSEAPDTASSETITPPEGSSFDRSTFYLAKKASGPYNVPVNVTFVPGSVGGSGNLAPIGYGAKPRGTNEVCPQVDLPPGWEQVKVYAFEGDFEARTFVQSFRNTTRKGVAGIMCNPGQFPSGNYSIQDCNFDGSTGPTPNNPVNSIGNEFFAPDPNVQTIVDRVLITDTGLGANSACFSIGARAGTGQSLVNPVSDTWRRTLTTATPPQSPLGDPPFNLGPFAPTTTSTPYAPYGDLNTGNLDNVSRTDQFLVVTPVTITSSELDPPTAEGLIYTPYRYRSRTECNSSNPSSCLQTNRIVYRYDDTDLATGAQGAFPICAVRPVAQ